MYVKLHNVTLDYTDIFDVCYIFMLSFFIFKI
jgi:hypothetical protein